MSGRFHKILKAFPAIDHAFAYGSGVFGQPGLYSGAKAAAAPMLDLVFGVQDPVSWHRTNIEMNPSHYSALMSLLGSQAIHNVSNSIGAGVYFNTLIPVDSAVIKYGVVSLDTMKKDLTDWNTLYIAGRLHKPVDTLITNESISLAQNENIAAAMRVAMLLCPQTFNMAELLRIICSLSYIGDVRLGFAEDSRKVQRIVSGSKTELFQLYHGSMITALDSNMLTLLGPSESVINLRSVFRNTLTLNSKSELYASLPEHVIHRIVTQKRGDKLPRAMRSVDHDTRRKALGEYIASSPYGALALQRALASIVRRSSFRQACLGIVSAGPLRSLRYVSAKVAKFLSSRR